MISRQKKPVNIVQSPPEWHTHEIDPVNWWKAIKSELEQLEEDEFKRIPHPITPHPRQ